MLAAMRIPRLDIIVTAEDGVSDLAWAARVQKALQAGRQVLALQAESQYSQGVVGTGDGLSHYSWYKLDTFSGFEEVIFNKDREFDVASLLSRAKSGSLVAWNDELKGAERLGVHQKIKEAGIDQLVVLYGRAWPCAASKEWQTLGAAMEPTSISWWGTEGLVEHSATPAQALMTIGEERVGQKPCWHIFGGGIHQARETSWELRNERTNALNALDVSRVGEL